MFHEKIKEKNENEDVETTQTKKEKQMKKTTTKLAMKKQSETKAPVIEKKQISRNQWYCILPFLITSNVTVLKSKTNSSLWFQAKENFEIFRKRNTVYVAHLGTNVGGRTLRKQRRTILYGK